MLHQRGRRRENLCARQQFISTPWFSRLGAGRQPLTVATVAIPPSQPWQQTPSPPPVCSWSLCPSSPAGCRTWAFLSEQAGGTERCWRGAGGRRELLDSEHGGFRAKGSTYSTWERLGCRKVPYPRDMSRGWGKKRRSPGYRSLQLCPQKPPSRWLHYTSSLLLVASPHPTVFSSLLFQHGASQSLAALCQPSSIPPASPLQLLAALPCLQQARLRAIYHSPVEPIYCC